MNDSFYIKPFKPVDLTEMYLTFIDAFSDYPISFKLSKEQFVRKFVQKLNIDFNLSIGTFTYDGGMAGFIFTALNYYEGKLTAYNGGTGVRPRYRGNKLTPLMYDYLRPVLAEKKVKQCVLEVLSSNERAIKAYTNIGFEKTKYFQCYTSSSKVLNHNVKRSSYVDEIFEVKQPSWHLYEKFCDFQPSFLDTSRMITDNLANETVIEARHDGVCVGYAIYQPSFGRISQIGIESSKRRSGIGSSIIHYIYETSLQKNLTIINVNDEAKGTKFFFESLGFENQIDQYEMILTL
jgi:ribosomal protein S18 acetylase RimI-like enzyme